MFLRIIHGKLKPGTWSEFEKAYAAAIQNAGPIQGLCGRWLTHDLDEPDSGTTISLWASLADLESYEKSDTLKNVITPRLAPFFSGEYSTSRSRVLYAEGDPAPSEWVGSDN